MKRDDVTHCPNCLTREKKKLFQARDRMFGLAGTFQIYQCVKCKSLYIGNPPNSAAIGIYYPSKRYYSYRSQDKDGFFGTLRKYLLAHYYDPTLWTRLFTVFIPNVPAIPNNKHKGKILDIGCGAGDTLVSLGELGWDTYGVDLDAAAIKTAKIRGVKHAYVGTYEILKRFPDNFFDAIRMYHVLEHIYDPRDCMSLIQKKLKSRGELIIGTPNGQSLVRRVFGTYWYNLDTPRHMVIFNPKALQSNIKNYSMRVTKVEFCSAGGILGSLGYLLSERLQKDISFLSKQWLVMICYPIELVLDALKLGDVFVIRSQKN